MQAVPALSKSKQSEGRDITPAGHNHPAGPAPDPGKNGLAPQLRTALHIGPNGIVHDFFNQFYVLSAVLQTGYLETRGRSVFKTLSERIENFSSYREHVQNIIDITGLGDRVSSGQIISQARRNVARFDLLIRGIKSLAIGPDEDLNTPETQEKIERLKRWVNLAGKSIYGTANWKRMQAEQDYPPPPG